MYIYVFVFGFKKFKYIIILLIDTGRHFKVLMANYICFKFSNFHQKIKNSK